jgi:hypothetical protein
MKTWVQLIIGPKYVGFDILPNPCSIGLTPYYGFGFFQSMEILSRKYELANLHPKSSSLTWKTIFRNSNAD